MDTEEQKILRNTKQNIQEEEYIDNHKTGWMKVSLNFKDDVKNVLIIRIEMGNGLWIG